MAPKPRPPQPCKNCGAPAEPYRTPAGNRIRPRFCTDCRQRFRHPAGTDHWHWRGGERSDKSGYVRVYVGRGRRALEHKAVWEAAYGPIPRGMHIHHINGDKTDNRIDNLALLSNKAHQAVHGPQRSRAIRWSIQHLQCVECERTTHPHRAHGLCNLCYGRADYAKRRHQPRRRLYGWSRKFETCIRCGTTAVDHVARGYCANCYQWWLRNRHSAT